MDQLTIPIISSNGHEIKLIIYSEAKEDALKQIDESEASEFGESQFQLTEGFFYEYKISEGYKLREIPKVVTQSKANPNTGRITPNIYVGTLSLEIINKVEESIAGITVEIRSSKTSYREDYRNMLADITEKCTDLLMQVNSPVSQAFTVDFNTDSQTIYQRFAFIKSVLDTSQFQESIHRILTAPVTSWTEIEEEKDIRRIRRINSSSLRKIASSPNRISIEQQGSLTSMPAKIKVNCKQDSVDTSENRFIKYALTTFLQFCTDVLSKLKDHSRAYKEAFQLEEKLENMLHHSVFKEVSKLTSLNLNNPVLQRKEGYREVLKVWLMFDLAAKLVWNGGEDIYHAGKRDVAVLYEYWLFFTLLDVLKEIFSIDPLSLEQLIEPTADGLSLKLKAGQCTALKGVFCSGTRDLNIEFCFNRTYSGYKMYPSSGSWTKNMRPDYSLSIWPAGMEREDAEIQELIAHIHFDAKYKISDLSQILGDKEVNLDEEKLEQNQGNYKRADLLKMHSYKDAIRRTAGAYILYPGSKSLEQSGFHEILPGLGAFPIAPRIDSGIAELKVFILKVVDHFLDRASQRERMSYRMFDIHKNGSNDKLFETIPEFSNGIRIIPPDDTSVLIGFCKDKIHRAWIERTGLYNVRMNEARGSLRLGPKEANADYLLLHSGNSLTGDLWRITKKGPKVYSRSELMESGYLKPSQEYYLVYEVEKLVDAEFKGMEWDIKKLEGYKLGRGSGLPFAVSLTQLMGGIKTP